MKTASHRCLKNILTAAAIVAALSGHGAVQSDLVCAYPPSTAAAWGGEANARVNIANQVVGSNALNDQSGTGESMNIVGYIMSSRDSSGEDNSTVLGLVAGNAAYADVRNYAASVGADQVLYIPYQSTGAAGNAYKPGTYSAINSTWWWMVVFAHEAGGHNYGCAHGDDHLSPKGIMMHNYCGGGAAYPYFYGNPNIWQNGVNLLGDGVSCLGGSLINGGDNAYRISSSVQGMCDTTLRVVYGPVLNNAVYHWCFTNAPAVVRGNGAAYTGTALRIPGGTTGNTAMSAMSAYIDLPNGIISSQTSLTIELWATPLSAPNWARILDFGRTTEAGDGLGAAGEFTGDPGDPAPGGTSSSDAITLTAAIGTDITQQRFEAKLNGTATTFNSALATTAGGQHHYAITFTDGAGTYGGAGGRWQWYRDGYSVAFLDVSNHLSSIEDVDNWLGRSLWSGDSNANNDYAEVRISNVAMNQQQVMANYLVGPNYAPRSATMTYSDLWNDSTRSFNAAGHWSDGLAPSAGKTYEMSDFNLTTPNDASPHTFGGDLLHASGGIFFYSGSGSSTITLNKFQIENEEICHSAASGSTFTLAGNLYVTNNNIVRGSGGPVNVSANLTGNGSLTLMASAVSLTGNNTNFTGKIRVGNGVSGSMNLSSEAQLGANPPSFTSDQLIFNRGWLYTTTSFTISNSNRGILIGPNDGIFDESGGTTLTLGCPLSSGYTSVSGNQLVTVGQVSGVVAGVLIKQNSGTLALTSANPDYNGAISINGGTLSIAGAGQLGGGTFGNPFTDNGVFDYSSSAAQTISSAISGTGSITKNGGGTLTLSGVNTMSGAVTINSGTLYANPGNAANNRALSYVSGITVNNGGTLQAGQNGLFGWDGTQEKPITVNAGGTLTCDSGADVGVSTVTLNGGTLANLGASTTYGSWRFDDASDRLLVTDNSTLSAVNVKFGSPAACISVTAGKTLTVNGTITDATSGGAGCLTISNGTGTVLLTGANTYTGTTTINSGRLALTNSSSLASPNIIVSGGATFDVSGLSSTFTLGGSQSLLGSGTNNGSVTTVSGAKIYAGTDGGYGTNTFSQNLTLVSGAAIYLDLNTSATGANDKLVVLGNLNLTNTAFHIKAPSVGANLDPLNDYTLATVSGTLAGTVNATPVWDVQAGNFGAFAVIVTNGNKIVLHAVAQPPSFTAGSATPASVGRNQTISISATVSQGLYAVTNVTANTTNIGGPVALTLIADGAGNYTNSIAATPDTTFGAKTIALTATDSGNISAATNLSVTVVATNRVWNGGSASDNNWSSNPNWSTSAAPGFFGDGVVFDGSTRLTPLMETNYSVTSLTFNNTAGSFTLGTSGKFLTLTGSGVTNNSAASQTINIPISMGAAQTLNAVAGNVTFSQNITNNGNLLTVSGTSNTIVSAAITGSAGLVKTGAGTLTLSGTGSYSGTTTVNAGTLNVSGSLPSTNITTVGGVAGKAVLTVSGTLKQQNLFVGNLAGATGAVYQTAGTITVTNGGGDCFNVGNIAGGYGYFNISGGTMLANGIAVGGENNSGTGFSGTGGNGLMDVLGGTVTNIGWYVGARGDTNETSVLNVQGGLFAYAGGGIVNCWGTNQTGIINVTGGVISNSTAVGINLNDSGIVSNTAILNLNGGTVQATGVSGPNGRVNFNGGKLRASGANTAFVAGIGAAMIYSNGATIDNNGAAVRFNTPLLAPAGKGVNGIASFTGGAGYIAPPIITVNRGSGDTTGVGATAIAQIDRNAGTVTNVIITCPGENYTATPAFALSGGGATILATITGQAPTTNASGALTLTGSGTLTLSGGNTYSGSTLVNGGTLRMAQPLVQMSFDNVVGSTVKNQGSGGSAMDGTITGTATVTGGGRFGNALSIGAASVSSGYVLINSPVTLFHGSSAGSAWTVALWVKTTTSGGTFLYQGSGSWASGNTSFFLTSATQAGSGSTYPGGHVGGVRWGGGWMGGNANVNDGNWHFISITDNSGAKSIYVDGSLDASYNAGQIWNTVATGTQLWIGGSADSGDGNAPFNGLIDEVYVYDRALTQPEIQLLFNSNTLQPLPATTPVSVASGAIFDLTGISQSIGSVSGAGKVTNSAGQSATLTLSNTTGSATFSGSITDQAASNSVSLIQGGAATTILSGANSYRGTTSIQGGSFLVNGSIGTNAVTIGNGGTLGGSGTIGGVVTSQFGGTLTPGGGLTTLTVSNNVTLQSGSTTVLEISKTPQTNDQLRVTGTLTFGGVLVVTNLSGTLAGGDSFKLFQAGSISGSFSSNSLPALGAGLAWNTNNLGGGVLSVVQTTPTSLVWNVSSTNLNLSWPAGYTGWRLQVQVNALNAGLGTNWVNVSGSSLTNNVALPMDATQGSVFYRLVYP